MSKSQEKFFDEKKEWSKIKDSLLGSYLVPYFQKLLHSNRSIHYIDGFAGPGKFVDGTIGSPMIAIDAANTVIPNSKSNTANSNKIKLTFIEKEHARELRENVGNKYPNCTVIEGAYQDEILKLIRASSNMNLFLYVDPFGIKFLDFSVFQQLSNPSLPSSELLINFNSNGFYRNACRAMGLVTNDNGCMWDDDDPYPKKLIEGLNSADKLSSVIGGPDWMNIILARQINKIDGSEAEKQITQYFIENLRSVFKYVVEIPIRISQKQITKYRLIHACNHPEGCLLMIDNMQRRKAELIENVYFQRNSLPGMALSDCVPIDNDFLCDNEIQEIIMSILSESQEEIRYSNLIIAFYMRYGIICPFKAIQAALERLEYMGSITIKRIPATKKDGTPRTFWNEDKGKKIFIKLNESQRIH